jgi:hypothetical protein
VWRGATVESPVGRALRLAGEELGRAFVPGEVAGVVSAAVAAAAGLCSGLRLAVEPADPVADLPWETLVLPGSAGALALHPHVQLYRTVAGTAPVVGLRGPLRILVALASPEGSDGGPLLDLEAELATILDAVEPARRHARAHIRILNQGTLSAVREALAAQRFHVLHLSCHAAPGVLLLENEAGRVARISARDLVSAIPVDRRPALVVLAGLLHGVPPWCWQTPFPLARLPHQLVGHRQGVEGVDPIRALQHAADLADAALGTEAVNDQDLTVIGHQLVREFIVHRWAACSC